MEDQQKVQQYITALKAQIGDLFVGIQERNAVIQQLQDELKKYQPEDKTVPE